MSTSSAVLGDPRPERYELRLDIKQGTRITLKTEPFLAFDDRNDYANPGADEALLPRARRAG